MKTVRIIVLFVSIAFPLFLKSCRNHTHEKKRVSNKLLFVLFDFSNSTDTPEARNNIIRTTHDILHGMPGNTAYFFVPITDIPQRALFDGNTGNGKKNATVYDNNADNYSSGINALRNEYFKKRSGNTCVINAVESVSETLNSMEKNKIKYDIINLIIISDMMECCSINGQFLNLEKRPFDKKNADRIIKEWPPERKFLSQGKKLKITVIFNSTSKSGRGYTEIKGFWKKLFKAAGYSKDVSFITDFNAGLLE